MRTTEHRDACQREGQAFADALHDIDLDSVVPTCPDWSVRDLAHHLGGVHRKVRRYVVERISDRIPHGTEPTPTDDALETWFRGGLAGVLEALRTAPDELRCFTLWPTDSPRAMWSRRLAHETAIHRADLLAVADQRPHYDTVFACDGIDEFLGPYISRPAWRPVTDRSCTIRIEASDADEAWTMIITPDTFEVVRDVRAHDVCVRGPASDLYLLLWNRRQADGLEIDGDREVLEHWRTSTRAAPQKTARLT